MISSGVPNDSIKGAKYKNLKKCQEFIEEVEGIWQVKAKVVLGFAGLNKQLQHVDPEEHNLRCCIEFFSTQASDKKKNIEITLYVNICLHTWITQD